MKLEYVKSGEHLGEGGRPPRPEAFLFYRSFRKPLALLVPEGQAQLLAAIFDYAFEHIEPTLTGEARMAFAFIREKIDADTAKYEAVCAVRRECGKHGGRPRKMDENQTVSEKPNGYQKSKSPLRKGIERKGNISSLRSDDISSEFASFWAVYPRREARKDAEKAWNAGKLDGMADTIVEAVKARIGSEGWRDPKYIPLPATFLRGRRWEDVPLTATAGAQGNGWSSLTPKPERRAGI